MQFIWETTLHQVPPVSSSVIYLKDNLQPSTQKTEKILPDFTNCSHHPFPYLTCFFSRILAHFSHSLQYPFWFLLLGVRPGPLQLGYPGSSQCPPVRCSPSPLLLRLSAQRHQEPYFLVLLSPTQPQAKATAY